MSARAVFVIYVWGSVVEGTSVLGLKKVKTKLLQSKTEEHLVELLYRPTCLCRPELAVELVLPEIICIV